MKPTGGQQFLKFQATFTGTLSESANTTVVAISAAIKYNSFNPADLARSAIILPTSAACSDFVPFKPLEVAAAMV